MNGHPTARPAPRLTFRRIIARYAQLFRDSRGWLLAISVLFAASIISGVLSARADPARHTELLNQVRQQLLPIREVLEAGDRSRAIGLVFWNNLRVTLLVIGTGALVVPLILGVPMFFIGINGYLLGALAVLSGLGPDQLALALLPHGIFELPAILISGAWSLKMGIKWLLPAAAGQRGDVWRQTAAEGLWIVPLVTVLLAIAAVVEILITAPLVGGFGP